MYYVVSMDVANLKSLLIEEDPTPAELNLELVSIHVEAKAPDDLPSDARKIIVKFRKPNPSKESIQ